ncbi:MAG: HAMP domain-containing sensor histidine kinase [Peptococcaceae bacterium]|nr:HAMP domain-containing sensor histidine kinase [Peptococcaceae bacterium]
MTLVILALFVLSCCLCLYFWQREHKTIQIVNRMLDDILDGEVISYPDIEEGARSALAAKMKHVQEKVDASVAVAEAEKESVKQLVSNMSHQLKTPLAGLMMYREMLEDDGLNEATRQKFLAKMKGQTEKLDWILNALFKMVELEQGAVVFEAVAQPLRPTLVDAISAVFDKAERRQITITLEPFEDLNVWHNRKWTAEVFVNILENAIKYSAPKSSVTVSVHPLELYTEIRFTDHGCGIRHEELNAIFQRFYRSSDVEELEGCGIGLALSRMILENEKGYITVISTYGVGSTFSVFLQICHN